MSIHRSFSHTVLRLACGSAAALIALSFAGCKKGDTGSDPAATPATTTAAPAATTTTAPAPTTTTTLTIPEGTPSVGWSMDSVYVRTGPGTDYKSDGGLLVGDKVEIIGREGDWYKIRFKGEERYVNAAFISPTEIPRGGSAVTTTTSAATTAATTLPAAQ